MNFKKLISLGLILILVIGFALVAFAEDKFDLENIPEIKNKKPLHMILEAGSTWEPIINLIKEFETKTGVKVQLDLVAPMVMYPKQNPELVAGTGYYDVAYIESSWVDEWSGYLIPIEELAAKYEPKGIEGLNEDLKWFSEAMLVVGQSEYDGRPNVQMGLPFYSYDQCMIIRQDVYDDPTEQAAFKAKYGYELKVPTTYKELYDQAEFFTRKKGDTLKGETLDHEVYGVAVMAGAYQINDEIATYLWGKGSDYVTVVKNPDGTVKEFVITKDNKEKLRESLTEYKSLLPFASPGCLTANYDFVCAQQGEGYAVIQPHQYIDLYPMVYNVGKEKLPEAKFIVYNVIGNKPYTGNYTLSVVRASKNPEAAYWLVRFLGSYRVQKEVMRLGIAACRNDVLLDPEWRTPEYAFPIGMMCDYLIDLWKDRAKDTVNYFFFNCKAAGKIYDLQSPLLHKAMSGEASIDEVIEELTNRTVELVSKFDPRPIRVEE